MGKDKINSDLKNDDNSLTKKTIPIEANNYISATEKILNKYHNIYPIDKNEEKRRTKKKGTRRTI